MSDRSGPGRPPWPDPPPRVIQLLRQVVGNETPSGGTIEEIRQILQAWEDREDIGELRELLGLEHQGAKGRRRTKKTAARRFAMAFALAEHRARQTPNAADLVAAEFNADARTVERAFKEWRPRVEAVVSAVREQHPGARIDYSYLLNR